MLDFMFIDFKKMFRLGFFILFSFYVKINFKFRFDLHPIWKMEKEKKNT